MADPKNYAVTDLAAAGALRLTIDGVEIAVSMYSASFALNEIPQAQCYVAVGATAAERAGAAAVAKLGTPRQMVKAEVTFAPAGEYAPDGTAWGPPQTIFRGYFTGYSSRKVTDKFYVVANLVHWLADMSCSSALTGAGHVTNPTQLNAAAVLDSLDATGASQGVNVSTLLAEQLAAPEGAADAGDDVWAAIRRVFCALASTSTLPCGPADAIGGGGEYRKNDRALQALAKIEGEGPCPFEPVDGDATYAVPLAVDVGGEGAGAAVRESIAAAIGCEAIESYSAHTFWDKLVTQFCPAFGMAVVPMVDRALVIADTPAYRGGVWKTIDQAYDAVDFTGSLERPQRGVGVIVRVESQTQAGIQEDGRDLPLVGGGYVEDSVDAGDGMIQFVDSPAWLRLGWSQPNYSGDTTGVRRDKPARAAGADAAGDAPDAATPENSGDDFTAFYKRYAQLVYVNNMLRGRAGSMAGPLRFDVAPGSILRIRRRSERFGAESPFEDQASTLIGCVNRVSITINAEGPAAATAFGLTHMRLEDPENQEDRTSVAQHPIFGAAIHGGGRHGAPLVPAYDFDA